MVGEALEEQEDTDSRQVLERPNLIILEDGERYRDIDENPVTIEIVGDRNNMNTVWFKANRENSISTLFRKNTRWISKSTIPFVYGIDEIYFKVNTSTGAKETQYISMSGITKIASNEPSLARFTN